MKLNFHKAVSKRKKKVAGMLLAVMISELVLPARTLALTAGPSQPEFQGFTPLATTSLVDPFSGDFSYNVPLLEIEGYPLNLVYRATSNIEEEGSWVGYGWNVNVGTLNRMVRGLPDDMNGDVIKSYQNIKDRNVKSESVGIDATIAANIGNGNLGLTAGAQASMNYSWDNDNYIGKGVGLSIGAGVFATINAGPLSMGGNAGVTLAANSNTGGSISTYAGFNVGATLNDYMSIGFGKSVNRTFNTITGWEHPNVVGSFNLSNLTVEVQRNFVSSISNQIPQVTIPYKYSSDGTGYRLKLNADIGFLDDLGINLGVSVTYTKNDAWTRYENSSVHKGYGYMYAENALAADLLDFTRDNDGGINKDMPFMPPAMKTFDVFSSTAHNASGVFRADRYDFGTVRDPQIGFKNAEQSNEMHEVKLGIVALKPTCWLGVELGYHNYQNSTVGYVVAGGCVDDLTPFRKSNGKDQNLFFRPCGAISLAKTGGGPKRSVVAEPIAVYTNGMIDDLPQTPVTKKMESYAKNTFPNNQASIKTLIDRPVNNETNRSKIGAVVNINKAGQTYVYATPVNNNVKNEVAFRVKGFDPNSYDQREGLMNFADAYDASQFNGSRRDKLYRNTLSPAYATSYLLNAVLSPDYVDVTNDGISDDDLGGYVKFNYTKTDSDYRWRVPYADKAENKALLNEGVKLTKFDDMGSYVIGSKQLWYAHSIESKNYVVEFYTSPRTDAHDSRSKIIRDDHPYAIAEYTTDKDTFACLQKLDSIKYYYKHDRYYRQAAAVPLKTIIFSYDYGISSNVPNSATGGKLRLTKLRVKHGNEPIEFAETYDLGYSSYNPEYHLGDKDGWGNYYPNDRAIPLCEFPYINQKNWLSKDSIASAFHLNSIGLPSGGKIAVEYEADDYSWVQDKRAMALTEIAGVGSSPNVVATDAGGLYDNGLNAYKYIYVEKPDGMTTADKNFLLNGSSMLYFSFNINIAGNAFKTYDQVKGYAEVESVGQCPNDSNYFYIKVKTVNLTGTSVKPSPMTNTAINMARAFASDQLYFQENEDSTGQHHNQGDRMSKAVNQVVDAIFGKNSIKELMNDFKAGCYYVKGKSYVKIALSKPKIGGGSRVSRLSFDDEWSSMIGEESSSLIGYKYSYVDKDGLSSGVASYEPLLGGEENPMRSGSSYKLTNNPSKYPPFDPIEMVKEDPAGESFFPAGSVGYSRVVIESIHKDYARSARSRVINEFYTAKDFPFFSSFGPKKVTEDKDQKYPNPNVIAIALSFMGEFGNSFSSSKNSYKISQDFTVETNDMHGKPKGSYNYRLLLKNEEDELVSSTLYDYHTNGYNKLSNDVDVLQHVSFNRSPCYLNGDGDFPKANIVPIKKAMGIEVDVCTDSREVVNNETRKQRVRGGSLKICVIPPSAQPKFSWKDQEHKHVDYYKATVTTKIVNRYGILKRVRSYKEGAETIVENKYYDGITGDAVVQVYKDKYGDEIYDTKVPAYWTKTDLEPSYLDYPFFGTGQEVVLPGELIFTTADTGILLNSNLLQSSFETDQDLFHPGDELFVKAKLGSGSKQWNRVYVTDVQVKKNHYADPDPLSYRFGNSPTPGATYKVYVTLYKNNTLTSGQSLSEIDACFKHRSGRRNMLTASAGEYLSVKNPFVYPDSIITGYTFVATPGGTSAERIDTCKGPSFMNPVIDATASRYEAMNAIPRGDLSTLNYNPVSLGILNQPYVGFTYTLFGDRESLNGANKQRGNGVLKNWYYWLPARHDSTTNFDSVKAMLTNWYNSSFYGVANGGTNAKWNQVSKVTKSVPTLGPVEETNPLDIFSSIFVDPTTKKVAHVTANGKFGQTWTETFEDMRYIKKYNAITDSGFSPFQYYMTKSSFGSDYSIFNKNQSSPNTTYLTGAFSLDSTQSHTGLYSILTTGSNPTVIKLTPKKYTGSASYYFNLFNFNLDNTTNQKYTYEVWVKGSAAPSVNSAGTTTSLTAITHAIDGWTLYRATINVSDNSLVTLSLPKAQYYDDMRMFPASSNVKTYVYHPFKSYLMAILDEQNLATFYEYNSRNQLVRLKKETEKGVITITENIKNIVVQ